MLCAPGSTRKFKKEKKDLFRGNKEKKKAGLEKGQTAV